MNSVLFAFKLLGINPLLGAGFGVAYVVAMFLNNDDKKLEKLETKARIQRAKDTLEKSEKVENVKNAEKLFK